MRSWALALRQRWRRQGLALAAWADPRRPVSVAAAPHARLVAEVGERAMADLVLENARTGWLHVRDLAHRAGWPVGSPGMPDWAPAPPGRPVPMATKGSAAA